MRGDLTCFHEPYGEAWYQGEDPLWPRLTAESVRTPGLTYDTVSEALLAASAKGAVFSKDFPHYILPIATETFLSQFNHSFLIRDPAKTIASMYKHWPDFHEDEVGFAEQRALFDRLCDLHGTPPPVIDSDDLLEDPHGMIESFCNAVGIPFLPQALSWEPGARDEVSWWDGGSFHENLRNSDGLKPQPRRHAHIDDAPDRVKDVHARALPHYQHLYSHRLKAADNT